MDIRAPFDGTDFSIVNLDILVSNGPCWMASSEGFGRFAGEDEGVLLR